MQRTIAALLGVVGSMALSVDGASAQQRFFGRIAGGGTNCVAVSLDITVDGSRVTGGGALAVASRTPVSVSGARGGDGVAFVIQHGAGVGDDRLQRIPMIGKFLAADRLEVWQDRDSQTCNPGCSSQGPGIKGMAHAKPDLAAYTHFLGSEAFSAKTGDSGTSAACPVLAGAVAALRTKLPSAKLAPRDLSRELRADARKRGSASWNRNTGYGIVEPLATAKRIGLA